jgi:hypothetical protein
MSQIEEQKTNWHCSPWVKVLEDPRGPGELARALDAGEKDAGMAVQVDVLDEEDRKSRYSYFSIRPLLNYLLLTERTLYFQLE